MDLGYALAHGLHLGLPHGGVQRLTLAVDIRFRHMVQVDQCQAPDPAARKRLGGPGAHAAEPDDCHAGGAYPLCAGHTIQPRETTKAAVQVHGTVLGQIDREGRTIAQATRSIRHAWYFSAATAPEMIAATATKLVALSVEMPLRPCPMVQPRAVTPPTPMNTAPDMWLATSSVLPKPSQRKRPIARAQAAEPSTMPNTETMPTVKTLLASLK